MVRRDTMFQIVLEELPELYPFIYTCYSSASLLNFGDHVLLFDEGFQQGDPLGLLLFCATSLKLALSMTSEFNVWYLDDGCLGGCVDGLLHDWRQYVASVLPLASCSTKTSVRSSLMT